MSPELELVNHWLQIAENDLRAAQVDLDVNPPLVEDACFHCQQVVEKVLKAFLTFHGIEFEKSHEIEYLLDLCIGKTSSFEQVRDIAGPLTSYAVRIRYPYPGPPLTLDEARETLSVARQVWNFVLPLLPREVHPSTIH